MNYVFGVDAGGTKTICAIGDTSGRLLAVGEGGPANYKLVGSEAAQGSIRRAIADAEERARLQGIQFSHGFYAVAGLDVNGDREIIGQFLEKINPAREYGMDNDAIASLELGSSSGVGVVLICGTGSNCVAVNGEGQRLQVGGLGREFGDFCGGREIALQAMAAAVRGYDGRGRETVLYDRIRRYLGVETLADFAPILHHSRRSYPIANLVPLVFEAAAEGDEVAIDILKFNGQELALLAEVAIGRLFPNSDSVEVVLTGGVFKSDAQGILLSALKERLSAKYAQVQYIMPQGDPVMGSLIRALRMAGVEVTPELKENLIAQYEKHPGAGQGV